jgi:hypothetical protein
MTLRTYILVDVLNVIGLILIFWLFQEDKPIGKLYDKCDTELKSFFAFLLFAIPLCLFTGRFIYFSSLIFLYLL